MCPYEYDLYFLHDFGWKNTSHISADVAMLGYGCGVSVYPHFFYDKKMNSFHMSPRPYIRSFDGQCSDLILKKEWVLNLAKGTETFVLEKIDLMIMSEVSTDGITNKNSSNQYWSHLKLILEKANEILPSTRRIGKTIFTSMAIIGGQLYRNHPRNLNHIQRTQNIWFQFG